MPDLIWTPSAIRDAERLHAFPKPKNPEAANRAVATIPQALRILVRHPEIGHPVEGLDPRIREWLIGFGSSGYLALYRLDGHQVVILTIRHSRELDR